MAKAKPTVEELTQYSAYLIQKMDEYNLSAKDMADIVGIDVKSIYRYRNGENMPNKEIGEMIKNYFGELDAQKNAKKAKEYIEEPGISEEEFLIRVYETEIADLMDDQIEGDFHQKIIDSGFLEEVERYNLDTQKYILKYFEVILALNMEDIELLFRMKRMDRGRYQKVVSYLEKIPADIRMIYADDETPIQRIDQYVHMIRSEDEVPKNRSHEIGAQGKGRYIKEVYQELYSHMRDALYAGMMLPEDLFERTKVFLQNTREDWYLLYLIERFRRVDYESGLTSSFLYEGKLVGSQEYMFLNFLKVVEIGG